MPFVDWDPGGHWSGLAGIIPGHTGGASVQVTHTVLSSAGCPGLCSKYVHLWPVSRGVNWRLSYDQPDIIKAKTRDLNIFVPGPGPATTLALSVSNSFLVGVKSQKQTSLKWEAAWSKRFQIKERGLTNRLRNENDGQELSICKVRDCDADRRVCEWVTISRALSQLHDAIWTWINTTLQTLTFQPLGWVDFKWQLSSLHITYLTAAFWWYWRTPWHWMVTISPDHRPGLVSISLCLRSQTVSNPPLLINTRPRTDGNTSQEQK